MGGKQNNRKITRKLAIWEIKKIQKTRDDLFNELKRDPLLNEIQYDLMYKFSIHEIEFSLWYNIENYYVEYDKYDRISIPTFITIPLWMGEQEKILTRKDIEETTNNNIMMDEIKKILKELSTREQMILNLHFGLDGSVSHSLVELGRECGVTIQRIIQIEKGSFEKIRQHSKFKMLKSLR